ncbi:hypothetical protein EOD42_16760 [Rhodovarius crocodyli]|uniref:Uncharacterized protein n=1 Tax=Rhodovarius crocodyli TaxID=1979269 RepID=A0A437MC71_9PROT|nr:hypothetical protein [Rhodovarius crocodyli]RVT95236.1 hypothetical protein EOD42_16760 [Rhodovarius crocodyli]
MEEEAIHPAVIADYFAVRAALIDTCANLVRLVKDGSVLDATGALPALEHLAALANAPLPKEPGLYTFWQAKAFSEHALFDGIAAVRACADAHAGKFALMDCRDAIRAACDEAERKLLAMPPPFPPQEPRP